MNRRNFLRLGALFVPLPVEPRRAYSFLTGRLPEVPVRSWLEFRNRIIPASRYVFTVLAFADQCEWIGIEEARRRLTVDVRVR